MTLVEYLTKNFSSPSQDLIPHFSEKFGVNVRVEGNLYQFKYDQISGKFSFPLTHECRGVIVRFQNGRWKWVSRPFTKFFNLHEGYCPLNDATVLEQELQSLVLVEKIDGTCIQLWFDDEKNEWRISTLGTITTQNVSDYEETFEELFWRVVGDKEKFLSVLSPVIDRSMTWIFELATATNRILTRYQQDMVYLIGAKDITYGTSVCANDLDDKCQQWLDVGLVSVTRPRVVSVAELAISSLVELRSWLEKQAKNTEKYGEYPEGFVVCRGFSCQPIAKLKHESYLILLAFSGGQDVRFAKKRIVESVVMGCLDDVAGVLSKDQMVMAQKVKKEYSDFVARVMAGALSLSGQLYPTRKQYALAVQAQIPKEVQGFFFQNQEAVVRGFSDLPHRLERWIRDGCSKFVDLWKVL
jgi:hypothetical protein